MKKITRIVMVMILLSAVLFSFSCKKEAESGEKAGADKKGEFLSSAVQAIRQGLILPGKLMENLTWCVIIFMIHLYSSRQEQQK